MRTSLYLGTSDEPWELILIVHFFFFLHWGMGRYHSHIYEPTAQGVDYNVLYRISFSANQQRVDMTKRF